MKKQVQIKEIITKDVYFSVFLKQDDISYMHNIYYREKKMEAINNIPVSLYKKLSDKLVSIILDSDDRDAISAEETKKIIYLWRQDQLASPIGIETLLMSGVKVDQVAVEKILDNLGLEEVIVEVRSL